MELDDQQKKTVAGWIEEGLGLADIQKKLREEMDLSLTYMDVRFLVIDMGLVVKDKEAPAPPPVASEEAVDPSGGTDEGGLGKVAVELDRVVKPGSIVSGTVTFGDGVTAAWSLDQLGRLALDTGQPGYKPSQEDMVAFQQELRSALEKRGF